MIIIVVIFTVITVITTIMKAVHNDTEWQNIFLNKKSAAESNLQEQQCWKMIIYLLLHWMFSKKIGQFIHQFLKIQFPLSYTAWLGCWKNQICLKSLIMEQIYKLWLWKCYHTLSFKCYQPQHTSTYIYITHICVSGYTGYIMKLVHSQSKKKKLTQKHALKAVHTSAMQPFYHLPQHNSRRVKLISCILKETKDSY